MSINKAILVGNLGKESGTALQPHPGRRGNLHPGDYRPFQEQGGEAQKRTEWHNIVAWGNLAEICGKYLAKGRQVYVEGRIQSRSYDDREGTNATSPRSSSRHADARQPPGEEGGGAARPARAAAPPAVRDPIAVPEDAPFNPDDDIPF